MKTKKILATVLAALMALGSVCVTSFAEEDIYIDATEDITAEADLYSAQEGETKLTSGPASIFSNGEEVFYESLTKAMSKVKDGETVKLLEDVSIGLDDMTNEGTYSGLHYYRYARVVRTNPVNATLDLNGHTISLKEDAANNTTDSAAVYRIFYISYGSTLNVIGKGLIDINASDNVSGYAFVTNNTSGGVTLNFNNEATIYGTPCVVKNYTVNGYGGNSINIYNGTYGISQRASAGTANNNTKVIFNSESTGNKAIQFKGGTLIGADPRRMDDGNLLSDGYAVSKLDNKYTVIPESSVAATVTNTTTDYSYTSFADAFANANAGDTITLTKDMTGNGIVINKDITIDLNGHTYDINGTTVGSAGTETNGFQILQGNTVTLKNGTITSNKARHLIQNYANLTLENVILDGAELVGATPYTLSHNSGALLIDKDSIIIGHKNGYAFDVCEFGSYSGAVATVETGAEISGKIQIKDYNGGEFAGKIIDGNGTEYTQCSDYLQSTSGFNEIEARSVNVYAHGDENSTTVYANDNVTVDVKLDGKNIVSAYYELTYDNTKFELTSELGDDELRTDDGATTTIKSMNYGQGFTDGTTLHTYTFRAIAQAATVMSAFTLSNVTASTAEEAIGTAALATTNGSAEIEIALREYSTDITFDGGALTEDELNNKEKTLSYDGAEHTFKVTATPSADVTYTVNNTKTDEVKLKYEGTYVITYNVENELGYDEVTGSFTITIDDPEYEVEVDLTAEGDYVLANETDGTKAKKIVLVYTNAADLFFKYNGKAMVDVTTQGYKYNNTTPYNHIYAYVTDYVDNNFDTYNNKVTYSTNGTNPKINTIEPCDINLRDGLEIDDIASEHGVYNGYKTYFAYTSYQEKILKADTNKNKKVDAEDIRNVTNAVRGAAGFPVNL